MMSGRNVKVNSLVSGLRVKFVDLRLEYGVRLLKSQTKCFFFQLGQLLKFTGDEMLKQLLEISLKHIFSLNPLFSSITI
jgi:hypothetical protein